LRDTPKTWRWLTGVIFMFLVSQAAADGEREYARRRTDMLETIQRDMASHGEVMGRTELSPEVARAILTVPRHLLVPANLRPRAYDNTPLPIGHGQTISQPTIVAMMTELLAVGPGDTVLEVGTGSGYQAAILGEMGVQVHSIEIVPELARSATSALAELGYENVSVHCGDGYAGLPDLAPFTGIIVTAAPPELPPALVRQLAVGGRLVAPVGPTGGTQWLTVWKKNGDGTVTRRVVIPVRFVPMVEDQRH